MNIAELLDFAFAVLPRPVISIQPGANLTFVNLAPGDDQLDVIKQHTGGGFIGLNRLADGIDLWHDDEFLFGGKPANDVATYLARTQGYPITYPYQGGTLAAGNDGPDTVPLTREQAAIILRVYRDLGGELGRVKLGK